MRDIHAAARLPQERATLGSAAAQRLARYMRPFWKQLLLVLVLILVGAFTQAAGPYLIGRAIDGAIGQRDHASLNRTMLLLLGIYGAGWVATRFQFQLMGVVGQRTLAGLRDDIFATIQRLSLRFFDQHAAGDLMSRLVNDTEVLTQLLSQGLVQVLGSLFGIAGIVIAMLALDVRLALASVAVIPVMVLLTHVFSRLSRRAFRRTREAIGDVSAELQEEIAGVRVAQAFNRTAVNTERFALRNAANRDANVSATLLTAAFTPAIDVLSTAATGIVAGYGGYLALHNQVTVGVVVAFLTYVQQFFRPIQQLSTFYTTAQAALAGAERIFDLVDTPADIVDRPDAQVLPPITGRVVFDHVSFSYGDRQSSASSPGASGGMAVPTQGMVLDEVSLVAEPGTTVAIVGPTGAGKTTLVNLIGRFYEVTDGRVTIDGLDVRDVTRASLRAQMGIVLQDSFLFSGTIADNIRYGRLGARDEELQAAARAANAHDFIMRLPDGYQTRLGERGGTLSQGQRQLLGIARAILAEPRILILDEATSSIDTRTEALIQSALKSLLRGRTSFVIAHRLSTIREADQVLMMERGRIVERGTHASLLAQDGAYAELYRRQFRDEAPRAGQTDGVFPAAA